MTTAFIATTNKKKNVETSENSDIFSQHQSYFEKHQVYVEGIRGERHWVCLQEPRDIFRQI